ncbi:hypothetical protein V1511DRAFT_461212 [Dipodascopsis uninucleata]
MATLSSTIKRKISRFAEDNEEQDLVYLDEQQQDELISSLKEENETINTRYKALFSIITFFQTPIYILHPILRHDGVPTLTIMAVTSLLTTTLVMNRTPITRSMALASAAESHVVVRIGQTISFTQQQLLIVLNVILSSLIALNAYVKLSPIVGIDYLWFSPIFSLVIIIIVRRWMWEGDVESLEQFRYKYKGA